ncbi:DUF484 family protein [Zooshikella ganghwensis]|uniref:DUF484 family protein n=1 Tax=Zooshikella ganghwensis TaxID=202772 RepID=UPI0003FA62D8|nr:DUF484 family protein [Zooshikella ganghwensis]
MKEQQQTIPQTLITEDEVADYLKANPNFLYQRPDILKLLEIPHPSGEATSLIERQVSLLRERNLELRNRLNKLLDIARENDSLFEKTRRLITELLEAKSLDEIGKVCRITLKHEFNVDFVSLILFSDTQKLSAYYQVQPLTLAQQKISILLAQDKPVCGVLRQNEQQFLFQEHAQVVGSSAVITLRSTEPLGILAIGSKDSKHFQTAMGTLFISYIADILSRALLQYWSH